MDPGGKGRPDLKLKRARHLLEELERAIDAYGTGEHFRVVQTANVSQQSIDFTLRIDTPPPLEEWGLVFGDCVHNMRAALDHLAWQVDPTPKAGPGGTAFPIYVTKPATWPPRAVGRMPAEAQRIIQGLQPYYVAQSAEDLDEHFLALVHSLDISDKHGVLLMTGVAVVAEKTKGLVFGASIESGNFPPFVDGAPVMQVRLPSGELQAPQLRTDVVLKVTLADRPNAPIVLLLSDLLSRVTQVVVDLTPFARP
jgi:hypothetical protein